ncbi:helix-turn-helix domain-containing protein [Hymenobacter aerilatus]|uniref:Helix-turn-helix domain-containing protein n=1 Tax=Hymenobacter aerilatus TaxID=2932251 RepID=A0A8T9SRS1_9BACT|nr:helix-turn-helix domain-containing protein [Hymenobacter aerilatus]UOR03724.1 helix-turn-helix domain-containing protein [Hymenobacter aerilatus]
MQNLLILADSPEAFRELLRNSLAELLPTTPAATAPDTLLTIPEVCKEFGVSKTTLTEWTKNGIVPFVRLGRRMYFERSQVLEAGRTHKKYQHRKG